MLVPRRVGLAWLERAGVVVVSAEPWVAGSTGGADEELTSEGAGNDEASAILGQARLGSARLGRAPRRLRTPRPPLGSNRTRRNVTSRSEHALRAREKDAEP